ncbi:hypothetical protein UVI_02000780 [Ustilaginoidea virens]|uniref:Uncharacterized protein n=1 Tax=Ustilaginoidea virens TaxID=1159556 RepID=A0A1B5L273_USTVR|nr:hypothetical protein UVI_02000780 [Ustilaginoidea virens]
MAPVVAFNLGRMSNVSLCGVRSKHHLPATHLSDGRDVAGTKCCSLAWKQGQANTKHQEPMGGAEAAEGAGGAGAPR